MRFSSKSLSLVVFACCALIPTSHAAGESFAAARLAARRELDLAKLELRHYWLVEYPRQRRDLNAAIDLTESEVRDLRAQLRSYGPFTRFTIGQPFMLTIQKARMCLQEAELRLNDLQAERNALIRFHSDDFRLLAFNVQEARLRVAEIEAQDPELRRVEPGPQNEVTRAR
jgi:hypothetical protein